MRLRSISIRAVSSSAGNELSTCICTECHPHTKKDTGAIAQVCIMYSTLRGKMWLFKVVWKLLGIWFTAQEKIPFWFSFLKKNQIYLFLLMGEEQILFKGRVKIKRCCLWGFPARCKILFFPLICKMSDLFLVWLCLPLMVLMMLSTRRAQSVPYLAWLCRAHDSVPDMAAYLVLSASSGRGTHHWFCSECPHAVSNKTWSPSFWCRWQELVLV